MPIFRPAKPKIMLKPSVAYVVGAGNTTAQLDLVEWVEGDIDYVSPGVVGINIEGLYLCSGGAGLTGSTLPGERTLNLRKSGLGRRALSLPTTSLACVLEVTVLYPCVAGDTIDLRLTASGATIGVNQTNLQVVRIGPKRWT